MNAGRTWRLALLGTDSGELTEPALDEMSRFSRSVCPVSWFLDVRDGANVSVAVSRTWTEWLKAKRERFRRIEALAVSPLFPLVLTVSVGSSGTMKLLNVHREPAAFEQKLRALAPEADSEILMRGRDAER